MSDLISRSVLIESIKDVEVSWYLDGDFTTYDDTTVVEIIEEQPTVDAVEVVRCKDCESYIPGKRSCKSEYLSGCTIPDGYCFNGERKKV